MFVTYWSMDSQIIKHIALEINDSPLPIEKRDAVYSHKYAEFKETYPTLFKMACARAVNATLLDSLLEQLNGIKTNNQSQHEASVQVGQVLFEKFVKPNITT